MALELLPDCIFLGPALPEPFVRLELEAALAKAGLLPKTGGDEGRALHERWEVYRRKLRELTVRGGPERVRNHVVEPLVERLGYARLEDGGQIRTSLDLEDGGALLVSADGASRLRVWTAELGADLDAPARRGAAYRYSPSRSAERVLQTARERLALLTNGVELRLLIVDPARRDSQIVIPIDQLWMGRGLRGVPDSYRLLLALASPAGVRFLPDLFEQARLQQTRVTKELRVQARQAVEGFVQEVLDHPENAAALAAQADKAALARQLWREGLAIIYRLLFVLKLESSDDPARRFSFADASLWRHSYSPGYALAPYARRVLDSGADTGRLLEDGLQATFRMLGEGVEFPALTVKPLAGGLFDQTATPVLTGLRWGERAVAQLLDRLLWTPRRRGAAARERVHYGPLEVEELGRVYEALLELEPGIAAEPMCRLRRQKLEVVVPLAQGEKYRASPPARDADDADEDADDAEEEADEAPERGKKTKVEWIEAIAPGRFYLRAGLGRKATGAYYTPETFVRFLVQETLGPQCTERSPEDDPQPARILALKVLDPATGSGHFLVGACRFLGDRLYEACRRCDELAAEAEQRAEQAGDAAEREALQARAVELRRRVEELPDPDNELVAYLPSRAVEGDQPGVSERKARVLCQRLVAVHCLYGVDKNPLAIQLARVALWMEVHAEGLPLTFLDHRLVVGDSLTGPFFGPANSRRSSETDESSTEPFSKGHLLYYPGSHKLLDDLFNQGLYKRFNAALTTALDCVQALEESVGINVADITHKRLAKEQLDRSLAPFRLVAAAWAGGVMLGERGCDDDAYAWLVHHVVTTEKLPASIEEAPGLAPMVARGLGLPAETSWDDILHAFADLTQIIPALPYDLTFPEVFFPDRSLGARCGFNAVVGNPPWDTVKPRAKEFFATFDLQILDAPTKREREATENRLKNDPHIATLHRQYELYFGEQSRIHGAIYSYQVVKIHTEKTGGDPDLAKLFAERKTQFLKHHGFTGIVVPSGFHANEGATGIRQLYLEHMSLQCCYSFENRNKIFEIDTRFKFALIVATNDGPTTEFPCAFYLHNDAWLFEKDRYGTLKYSLDFVKRTGYEYLSLLELRSSKDSETARICFANGEAFGKICKHLGIRLGRELDMTNDSWRFIPCHQILAPEEDPRYPKLKHHLLNIGYITLIEGKNISTFNDLWPNKPKYLLPIKNISMRDNLTLSPIHYRIALRKIQSSQNERTLTIAILPAAYLCGDSIFAEQSFKRPNWKALSVTGYCSSYTSDWLLRQFVAVNVNLFIVNRIPLPWKDHLALFLAHCALRLSCNHAGYAPLWREQVGGAWREERAPFDWPALAGDDARWRVRAAIDAVVADAYGLSREQYAHVLSTFSHKSYPAAPALCLAAYDELAQIGLEAFARRHDPYWDIPLNEALPQPVIELPAPPADDPRPAQQALDLGEEAAATPRVRLAAKRAAERRASSSAAPAEATSSFPDAPVSNRTPSATNRHIALLARIVKIHRDEGYEQTLGHIKAERIAHLAEAHLGLDVGGQAGRYLAGPVDFSRFSQIAAQAQKAAIFADEERPGDPRGNLLRPLANFQPADAQAEELLGDLQQIDTFVRLFCALDTRQTEIVAMLYVGWNNQIYDGEPDDTVHLWQACAGWSTWAQDLQPDVLLRMHTWMQDTGVVPRGQTRLAGAWTKPQPQPKAGGGSAIHAPSSDQASSYDQLKSLLAAQVVITSSSAQEALGLDAAAVRPLLRRLVDEGLARQEGERRGTRYRKL